MKKLPATGLRNLSGHRWRAQALNSRAKSLANAEAVRPPAESQGAPPRAHNKAAGLWTCPCHWLSPASMPRVRERMGMALGPLFLSGQRLQEAGMRWKDLAASKAIRSCARTADWPRPRTPPWALAHSPMLVRGGSPLRRKLLTGRGSEPEAWNMWTRQANQEPIKRVNWIPRSAWRGPPSKRTLLW